MQKAQLSNVKPDGNYPELVSHLQCSHFSEVFFFFFFNLKTKQQQLKQQKQPLSHL